jgi:hypothetical protein
MYIYEVRRFWIKLWVANFSLKKKIEVLHLLACVASG